MNLGIPEAVGIITVIVAATTFMWTKFVQIQRQLASLDTRLSRQELKMDTLWPVVTDTVKNLLMHPTSLRKDELLTKFPKVTCEELRELNKILTKEKEELVPTAEFADSDTKVYIMALGLMLSGVRTLLIDKEETC